LGTFPKAELFIYGGLLMKSRIFYLVLIISVIFSFSACTKKKPDSVSTTEDSSPSFVLKAGHTVAADHPYQFAFQYMDKLLDERTNGKIRLEIYPSAQLGGERELFESAQMGTVDLALGSTAPLANFDQSFLVFDLPYLFENRQHAYRALDGAFGERKFAGLEKSGMVGLGYWDVGYFAIANSKKILQAPTDAAGMNIRVMENEIHMGWITAMNANPVPMAYSEVFTAVQNGTVDGLSTSISSICTSKLHTVAPFITDGAIYGSIPLIMSKQTWDKMTPEYQQIVKKAAEETRDYERDLVEKAEIGYIDQMRKEGATVHLYTPEETAVWVNAVKAKVWNNSVGKKILQADVDEVAAYAKQ
jgi:tripartite ATP-independent transporter DctP family solute receptor